MELQRKFEDCVLSLVLIGSFLLLLGAVVIGSFGPILDLILLFAK